MNLKEVVCELTKEDDTQLLREVMGMTILHGAIINGIPGIIFNSPNVRKSVNQYPNRIQAVSMGYDGHCFNHDELKLAIEKATKETLLVYRDKNGKLISPLYLGRQFEDDPFTRAIWTDKPYSRNYYKRDSWGRLLPTENINNFFLE
ncbi:hypothetical protein J4226_05425 [Candidatus Pacearchaeota archaeon]|nr:hypothetical protein [Candidatus Pacearchaeota archaeon]